MIERKLKKSTPDPLQAHLPLISVITAVYNAGSYLNDCILSVLSQQYENFEYIVIDGGSTDNTVDIIKQHQNHITYWISERDEGIYDAWNKGLSIAKGEWISFIGADDILEPDALNTYMSHILQHPMQRNLEFVSSRIELVNEDLTHISIVGAPWQWERFKKEMITWHVGSFHAKHLFDDYGIFDKKYKICGDYELLLRPKDKLITSYIHQQTVKMRVGGVSSTRLYQSIDETYHAKMKNGAISVTRGKFLSIIDKARTFIRNKTWIKII